MPLKPEFKEKTLRALRSGKYKQYRNGIGSYLGKELCCIGVAADANGKRSLDTYLAAEYIGLTDREREEWVEWNDCQQLNFYEIADLIEWKY